MRELILSPSESTTKSLVFNAVDEAGVASGEQFFLAVDDSLRAVLLGQPLADDSSTASVTDTQGDFPSSDAGLDSASALTEVHHEVGAGDSGQITAPVSDRLAPSEHAGEDHARSDMDLVSDDNAGDAQSQTADAAIGQAQGEDSSKATGTGSAAGEHKQPRPHRDIDPRLSKPLKTRPREIQERIRAGATIAELAAENDVVEARIEPYAHPVLLERARIAELAKSAHPVRDDGPAKLTLWEVLATAFAARGLDLSTTTWDAYRDAANQWVVKVSWKAGLSENEAEWAYLRHGTSQATAVARNGIAADLIDPDFAKPVRTLSTVAHGVKGIDALIGTVDSELERTLDDIPAVTIDNEDDPDHGSSAGKETLGLDDGSQNGEGDAYGSSHEADAHDEQVAEAHGEDFLQHPGTDKPASKRRRKAVTPHWEDVLLGVRANTKRPRN